MFETEESNTVLVIEDDDDIRGFVCCVLELEGYSTLQSGDGLAGLKLAREHRVAIVLLDLRLPDCSGWQILQEMKTDPAISSIPVVVFTVWAGVTQKEKALAMGAQEYMIKPFSASTLRQAVINVLNGEGVVVSCR